MRDNKWWAALVVAGLLACVWIVLLVSECIERQKPDRTDKIIDAVTHVIDSASKGGK